MDLGVESIPGILTSGATAYLVEFKDLFLLIAGLLLAFGVIGYLIDILVGLLNDERADDMEIRRPRIRRRETMGGGVEEWRSIYGDDDDEWI